MAIYQTAHYQVKAQAVDKVKKAIEEFVRYVKANEPGTEMYIAWQETEDPTKFVHLFKFRDAAAHTIHGESAAVKRFAGILYPKCVAPVEFVTYTQVDANASFRRV